jgi:hypothetical protein
LGMTPKKTGRITITADASPSSKKVPIANRSSNLLHHRGSRQVPL